MSSTSITTTFGAPAGGAGRSGQAGVESATVLPIRCVSSSSTMESTVWRRFPPAGDPSRRPEKAGAGARSCGPRHRGRSTTALLDHHLVVVLRLAIVAVDADRQDRQHHRGHHGPHEDVHGHPENGHSRSPFCPESLPGSSLSSITAVVVPPPVPAAGRSVPPPLALRASFAVL